MSRIALLVALLGLSAASGCPRSGKVDAPPRENRMRSGYAPTPFSAKQIRQGCRPGTWRKYRVEISGRRPSYRVLRFSASTPKTTVVVSEMTDLRGKPFGEQRRMRALWKGLQAQSSFPEGQTTIRSETRRTPAGTFDCWRYEVRSKRVVKRFWFAKRLPGPPIHFEHLVAGKRVFRMTLVAFGRARPTR